LDYNLSQREERTSLRDPKRLIIVVKDTLNLIIKTYYHLLEESGMTDIDSNTIEWYHDVIEWYASVIKLAWFEKLHVARTPENEPFNLASSCESD
jgi:hypothetical protein